MVSLTAAINQAVEQFLDGLLVAIPRVVSGGIFLFLAYLLVRGLRGVARRSLDQLYPAEQELIVDLSMTLLSIVLWFAVGLTFLRIVGMGEIAASLGTASGFIALGVSYALSEMIEDTVAGVYLLRDPDFNVGDRITSGVADGTVAAIGLRKSRIETDSGDRVIVANRQVEQKWTLVDQEHEATVN